MPIKGINTRSYIFIACVLMFSMSIICFICFKAGQFSVTGEHFYVESDRYLNGNKIDLPEEISQMSTDRSNPDWLVCYRDTTYNVLHLCFDRTDYYNLYHEYQLELELDSMSLYDQKRFIGKVPYTNSPLDSLLMADNE